MEKPLAQFLLVNPWLAAERLWASCWVGCPLSLFLPTGPVPFDPVVAILFHTLPAVISLQFARIFLPSPWAAPAASPPRGLGSQLAPLG